MRLLSRGERQQILAERPDVTDHDLDMYESLAAAYFASGPPKSSDAVAAKSGEPSQLELLKNKIFGPGVGDR